MLNSLDYVWIDGDPARIGLIPEDLLEMLECAADGVVVAPFEELLKVLSEKACATQTARERVKEPLSHPDPWEGEELG